MRRTAERGQAPVSARTAQLDLELERDLAPAATFATTASRDFLPARIGCQLYQPLAGIDLAALCLRNTGS